jgi:hypothetical protein
MGTFGSRNLHVIKNIPRRAHARGGLGDYSRLVIVTVVFHEVISLHCACREQLYANNRDEELVADDKCDTNILRTSRRASPALALPTDLLHFYPRN